MAPSIAPPPSIITPPPMITTPGRLRSPACIMPGWLIALSSVVLLRKVAEVHALPVAVGGVCGPAKRSRNRTCGVPKRSTTATAT